MTLPAAKRPRKQKAVKGRLDPRFIGASEATTVYPALSLTREQLVRRIQKGTLRGRYDAEHGWVVERASITEYLKEVA